LVTVHGVPLLERNLLALLSSGFRDLVVAVPNHTPEIARFVGTRGEALAVSFGARLRVFEEIQPLGNIGAAAEVGTGDADLVVVYADNLTALDLNALLRYHHQTNAALTSAVHSEPFQIPYGEVQVENGMIVAYNEKPERRIQVSSGVFVLGAAAIAQLPRGRRTEVAWLANRLLAGGCRVAAFQHEAPWIDVNDSAAIARAEQLISRHKKAFESQQATADPSEDARQ
jgi:NDP-sugar pyrophosphorylase family protein